MQDPNFSGHLHRIDSSHSFSDIFCFFVWGNWTCIWRVRPNHWVFLNRARTLYCDMSLYYSGGQCSNCQKEKEVAEKGKKDNQRNNNQEIQQCDSFRLKTRRRVKPQEFNNEVWARQVQNLKTKVSLLHQFTNSSINELKEESKVFDSMSNFMKYEPSSHVQPISKPNFWHL